MRIVDNRIPTQLILDGAVTLPKLPDGVLTADASGRAKMADGFINNAKVASDANVAATKLQTVWIAPLLESEGGAAIADPGTAYAEAGVLARCRGKIDFSLLKVSSARVVVSGIGNEAGAGKGVEIYNVTDAVSVCVVTWDGNAQQDALAGSWTAFTPAAEKVLAVRVKGSSATEDITLQSVTLQLK